MPFSVEEFRDLIRLLEERPEWRADLRRLILSDELLTLPELVRELTQAQQRTEVRVGRLEEALIALTEAQQRTEVRVGRLEEALIALTEAQQRTEVRVGRLEEALIALTEAQQRTEVRVGRLEESLESLRTETDRRFQELAAAQLTLSEHMDDFREAMRSMEERYAVVTADLGELKGSDLERRYRERPFAYFSRLIRQAHALTGDEINAMLDKAMAEGQLSEEEAEEISWADAIVRGRRRENGDEVYLVVEVSWGVGPGDVERAASRAAVLAKAGVTTVPVVAGRRITSDGELAARAMKVWQVTDGRVVAPEEP
jgi:chromosome segregation ATPase